jgi:hypothetical protein
MEEDGSGTKDLAASFKTARSSPGSTGQTGAEGREENGIDLELDAKYAQIGIRWGLGPEREWENRPWLKVGLPVWIDAGVGEEKDGVNGLVVSPFDVGGGVNGAGFSIFSTEIFGNGVIMSPLFSAVGELNGLNFGLVNFCSDGYSVQLGAVNWRELWGRLGSKHDSGIAQIGLFNRSLETNRFQIGVFNDSRREQSWRKSDPYLQLGLINLADNAKEKQYANGTEKSFSLQIGLWNYNGRWWGFPLLNVTW